MNDKFVVYNTGKKRSAEVIKANAEAHMMPKERELAIVAAYRAGDLISDIKAQFNTSESCIYRVKKRNGNPEHGCDKNK